MKKKILFMDNSSTFLDVHARLLEQKGYDVLRALTLESAEAKLQAEYIHLAILDIRMEDEDDDQDISGLWLARQAEYQSIPKLILTAHTKHSDSYKYVRDALEPSLNGRAPAVGFVGKTEGPDALLQAVERAFSQHVRIHWNLAIRWQGATSLLYLANLLEPTLANSTQVAARVDELEGLLRKLFYSSRQIVIGRLLVQRAEKLIFEIYAYDSDGTEEQFVIACGYRDQIREENTNYTLFVRKWGGPVNTIQRDTVETSHFAATLYQLISGNLDEIIDLRAFYARRRTDEILVAVDYLFTSLIPWYNKNRFYAEAKSLNASYCDWLGLSIETLAPCKLEQQMEMLCKATWSAGLSRFDYAPNKLTFHEADGSFVSYPNPVAHLYQEEIIDESSTLCSVTHGRLDASSILVDPDGQTWLVDFAKTGQGPLLRDFVTLEMAVRLDLLDTSDLPARHKFEKQLIVASKLMDAFAAGHLPVEFDKPLRMVEHIRQRAAAVAGPDLTPYLLGLFFCALARIMTFDPTIRYTKRELVPFAHSLLLAAMLSEKLTDQPQSTTQSSSPTLAGLWLNESNREVWVEGRQAELTPQDFDILAYLYRNRSQVCSRQAIVENALGEVYKEESTETSRLNSAMSRLRQKIESDPEHPKYLITIRGYGYKLM